MAYIKRVNVNNFLNVKAFSIATAAVFVIAVFVSVIVFLFFVGKAVSQDFLEPEQAFYVQIKSEKNGVFRLEIKIASGYYLYQDKLYLTYTASNKSTDPASAISISLPVAHEMYFDENFQKTLAIYRNQFNLLLDLSGKSNGNFTLNYQGCADQGLCYAPMQFSFTSQKNIVNKEHLTSKFSLDNLWLARDDAGKLGQLFLDIPYVYLILCFIFLGVLLAFTPCVLPMLPIIATMILQKNMVQKKSEAFIGLKSLEIFSGKKNILLLTSSYVFGMSLIYATMGVLVATAGISFAVYLQNIWIQGIFAILLFLMSLELFDCHKLQILALLTKALHKIAIFLEKNKNSKYHNIHINKKSKGKSLFASFSMGAISALLIGPCVTPPLAAILLMIAQTGHLLLGGSLLFCLAIGMGLPLIVVAIGAGKYLPSSGPWLIKVKYFFGTLLLLLSIWFAWPVFIFGYQSITYKTFPGKAMQSSSLEIHKNSNALDLIQFKKIADLASLKLELQQTNKPIMLNFYADWCIACKELEYFTFRDQLVLKALMPFHLLQVDITKNTTTDKELLQYFKLFGPPAIIFFDKNGIEIPNSRIIGYQNSEKFQLNIANL